MRRGERVLLVAGAAVAIGALRSKVIDRQSQQHPYVVDPSLPVPCELPRST